tara:strand:- start:412 stop:588 length:177 start_codon:yes stop_codon:yes gene_type:complete
MNEHDYDNGYRAGMQKMRDLAQARIDELQARIKELAGLIADTYVEAEDEHDAMEIDND